MLCSVQVLKDQSATMKDGVFVNREFMETSVTAVKMALK